MQAVHADSSQVGLGSGTNREEPPRSPGGRPSVCPSARPSSPRLLPSSSPPSRDGGGSRLPASLLGRRASARASTPVRDAVQRGRGQGRKRAGGGEEVGDAGEATVGGQEAGGGWEEAKNRRKEENRGVEGGDRSWEQLREA